MKTKTTLFILLLQLICVASFGQLRIVNSGDVCIGTNTPNGKLNVNHEFHITGNGRDFRFMSDNPNQEIGSNTGIITFWYTTTGGNSLIAQHFFAMSDSTLKQDISPADSAVEILKQLNAKKYHFKPILDTVTNELHYDTAFYDYGFLAQDVEQVLPGLVKETKGFKAVCYEQLIPLLVEAIKKHDSTIDSLNSRLSTLEQAVDQCCSSQRVTGSALSNKQTIELSSVNSIILRQNDPNPFSQKTTITWFLPEDAKNAKLYFYDNKGSILRTVLINETGNGELLVYCSDLKSGIYTYSLVVNDKVVDTKKMVCTK